ncbi:MAG TPA: glutamate formimidoyltransferase [Bacteroidales bacterium]|nr:glutamate formimidoyltransferase [Bacteroidales bacterium]
MNISDKIVECVPNFSEGRDKAKIERIVDCFRGMEGVKLLDYSNDVSHNRMVVTAVGSPEAMKKAVVNAIGTAVREIDLNQHRGEHPRMGAADVVPFIPIRNMTMEEAVQLAKEVAVEVSSVHDLPVYLYEKAASAPHRENLADVRKGQFEGLVLKMQDPLWKPDFGPTSPHPTAGASIVGARNFLIAWNVNLNTDNLEIAKAIAKKIRFSSGGFPCVKALGLYLADKGQAQVSMNLTDFTQTSMHQVFDCIREEAASRGVSIACSEVIGMLPLEAVVDSAVHYLQIEDFSKNRILENRLLE